MARPKEHPQSDAKMVIYSRIDPATIEALDRIRELMRPKPTRAQLIDLAVAEYVERHGVEARERKSDL